MAGDRFTFTTYSDDNRGVVFKSDDQKNKKSDGTGVTAGNIQFDSDVTFNKNVNFKIPVSGGINWFTDTSTTGLNNNKFSPLSGFTKNLGKNDIPSKATAVLIRAYSTNSSLWSDSWVTARHTYSVSGHSYFYQRGRSADNRPRHSEIAQIWVPVVKNSSGTRGIWLHWTRIQNFLILGWQ
jgi:hypothetical protein